MQTLTTAQQVQKLLRWSQLQYNEYMFEIGLLYLKYYIDNDIVISCITKSRIFWNWWKLGWYFRDLAFIEQEEMLSQIDCAVEIYFSVHDAKTLAKAIYPSGVVLQESFAIMMGELQKKEVAHA